MSVPQELTLLRLVGVGVPPYSARGVEQTLAPIDESDDLRRAIDGTLMDLSYAPFRKFKTTLSCDDMDPPAVSGKWPGQVVTVECVSELAAAEYDMNFDRPAVEGSIRQSGGFYFYRPILEMMVVKFQIKTDEYGAAVGWSMDLEEV